MFKNIWFSKNQTWDWDFMSEKHEVQKIDMNLRDEFQNESDW